VGTTVQCAHQCNSWVHVTCAQEKGLLVEEETDAKLTYLAYCPSHEKVCAFHFDRSREWSVLMFLLLFPSDCKKEAELQEHVSNFRLTAFTPGLISVGIEIRISERERRPFWVASCKERQSCTHSRGPALGR